MTYVLDVLGEDFFYELHLNVKIRVPIFFLNGLTLLAGLRKVKILFLDTP